MHYEDLEKYNYTLPEKLIRKVGVEPRDSARLFVYDTKKETITFDVFRNLEKYLPEDSLLVLNNTRVLPARLWLTKETGGKIEVFVLANEIIDEERIPVLVDRKTEKGKQLYFPNQDSFEVIDQNENIFYVKLHSSKTLEKLLLEYGETPVPHYLEGASQEENELRRRYQTIFAQTGASVAAPTASLHFTEDVFHSLKTKNIATTTLTLNVGLGTFSPLEEKSFEKKRLHPEFVDIPEETAFQVNEKKKQKQKIVAVGTTVTRTLEAFGKNGQLSSYKDKTDIFIYPPYEFKIVDAMITNFHLPKTSLMLLVDAFLQHKKAKSNIIELYDIAIKEEFCFYSFGDSMLIL